MKSPEEARGIATCPLGHSVPTAQTDFGYDLPFCEPHMALLPPGLQGELEQVAGASIFEVEEHEKARELVERATEAVKRHRGPVRGICRKCGCTDEAGCPEGCSWVDKAHTLCSSCK